MMAFVMTSMQSLRLLIVLSSTAQAIYYYLYPAEPLWLDVGFELALIVINGFMLLFLVWSNSRIKFDQREQFLYENEFSELTRVEFNQLLKISEWELKGWDFVYTVAGKELKDIFYLISGRAEAELTDGNTAMISEGSVIGEVSYCLQCPASASVTAKESCMCLRWNQKELRALYQKNENIKRTLDTVLSSHMARKLSETMDDRETPAVDPV
jgi:CRP-like cAMP-binding protein